MMSQRLLTNCIIKNANNLIVRNKSVVIRQIDTTKLTKAQRMKKLNYETSYLFGSKIKSSKKASSENNNNKMEIQANKIGEENETKTKGINSEIYWTVENNKDSQQERNIVIEKLPKRRTKKVADSKSEATSSASPKKSKKVRADEILPETVNHIAKFKLDFPKPVKLTVQDALNSIDSKVNSNIFELNEIPFDEKQLRNLINFPLIIEQNDLVAEMFDKSAGKNFAGATPSVSKIIQATMSANQKKALQQWKNLKIAELGLQGFEDMQSNYLARGKKFHECLQKYFSNVQIKEEDLSIDIIEVWKSIAHVIKDFEQPAVLTEHHIYHPYLCYKGIVDCVAVHRESQTISVIEWKNSDRYKRSVGDTYDAPMQLAAYLSALNATEYIDNPLKHGIVVVAYNDGTEADYFKLSTNDLKRYWKIWLNRVQDYWVRYRDNTLNLDEN